jgi:hypothetical protein
MLVQACQTGASRPGAAASLIDEGELRMSMNGDGPRPSWIPGHARRHERTGELDTRWMPACQCGWTFYASVRTLRIADRTHGFHLDRVHSSRSAVS